MVKRLSRIDQRWKFLAADEQGAGVRGEDERLFVCLFFVVVAHVYFFPPFLSRLDPPQTTTQETKPHKYNRCKIMDLSDQIEQILLKRGNYINGHDSEDTDLTYSSIAEWKACTFYNESDASTSNPKEASEKSQLQNKWYQTGYDYYEDESKCPATVNGVLGGFACLSSQDLKGSRDFMLYLQSIRPELKMTREENGGVDTYALECGAGTFTCTVNCF